MFWLLAGHLRWRSRPFCVASVIVVLAVGVALAAWLAALRFVASAEPEQIDPPSPFVERLGNIAMNSWLVVIVLVSGMAYADPTTAPSMY